MVRNTGCSVKTGFKVRILAGTLEARVGIGTGIQQRRGCAEESVAALLFQPQILGEAETGEGIGVIRRDFGRDILRISCQKAAHRSIIAQNRRDMNAILGNLRMRRQNLFSGLQRPCQVAASMKAVIGSCVATTATLYLET